MEQHVMKDLYRLYIGIADLQHASESRVMKRHVMERPTYTAM